MEKSDWDLAEEHAHRIAPRPKYEPGYAGIVGFFCTALVAMVFAIFARVDVEVHHMAFAWTSLIGGSAVYLWFRSQSNANRRAFAEKLKELQADALDD